MIARAVRSSGTERMYRILNDCSVAGQSPSAVYPARDESGTSMPGPAGPVPEPVPGRVVVARREVWSATTVGRAGEVSGMRSVETVLFLVVLGTVVAAFAGRLRFPAPSLLVIAGLVVALLPRFPAVHVPPEVVSLVVLPPLLYAASEELPWRDLRAVWRPVAVLAVGLVLASAAAVAAVAGAVASLSASMAFVLGAGDRKSVV